MRKKLITMGPVSALGASTSAMAADLDATTVVPEVYATGTALAGTVAADGTLTVDQLGDVVTTTAFGFGVAGGNQTYVRFDLSGAEFGDAVTAADLAITNNAVAAGASTAVAQGGASESSFVIFDVTSNTMNVITQASNVAFTPANVGATPSGAATVTMAVYDTPADASNQQNALYSISGPFLSFTQGLGVDTEPTNATAEVSTGFTLFTGGSDTAEIGNFAFDIATAFAVDDGAQAALADFLTGADQADLTLSGDVSFGDWFIDDTTNNCGTKVVDLVEDTDTQDTATANAGALGAGTNYSLCVEVDGDEVINASSYGLLFEWDTGTRPLPISDTTINVGGIVRNGTTKYIPYMTTFEDYNQRLVIVNRGASAASYSITFTTEDGTTATAGSAATGSVPAGEVLSIKVSDIVTLAGKTRTAATLVVVAPSGDIDVATNQVNLSDGSTDTVVY